jgi:hypothetical protein
MRGVLLAPKGENIATEFTEITERLFSSQMQHTQGLPFILSCSLCSLWLKTEFTEVTERLFSSQTQHTRRWLIGNCRYTRQIWGRFFENPPFLLPDMGCVTATPREPRRFPSILLLSVLSVAQILIPLVIQHYIIKG